MQEIRNGDAWRHALAILVAFLAAALAAPANARAQECSHGHPPFASLGIGEFLCVGGSCSINAAGGDPYLHSFSTEPRVRDVDPEGPAAGVLREDDVIVSVDGVLITTAEGGRRLGSLKPGEPVRLTVRRQGREVEVGLTPERSCDLPALEVSLEPRYRVAYTAPRSRFLADSAPGFGANLVYTPRLSLALPLALRGEFSRPGDSTSRLVYSYGKFIQDKALFSQLLDGRRPGERPSVELGFELTCGECGWQRVGSTWSFRTQEFPVVRSVERDGPADEAGLGIGDVILTVGGGAITSEEAGQLLGALEAGEPVALEVRRGDTIVTVRLTPRAAGEHRQRM
jgi:hypothetical protein